MPKLTQLLTRGAGVPSPVCVPHIARSASPWGPWSSPLRACLMAKGRGSCGRPSPLWGQTPPLFPRSPDSEDRVRLGPRGSARGKHADLCLVPAELGPPQTQGQQGAGPRQEEQLGCGLVATVSWPVVLVFTLHIFNNLMLCLALDPFCRALGLASKMVS